MEHPTKECAEYALELLEDLLRSAEDIPYYDYTSRSRVFRGVADYRIEDEILYLKGLLINFKDSQVKKNG